MRKLLPIFCAVMFLFLSGSFALTKECKNGHEERRKVEEVLMTRVQCHTSYCTEVPVFVPQYEEIFVCDEYENSSK